MSDKSLFASFAEHSRYSSAWQFHLHCLALIAGGQPQSVDIVFVPQTYVEKVAQCSDTPFGVADIAVY